MTRQGADDNWVAHSLKIGDHWHANRGLVWSLAAFALVTVSGFMPKRSRTPDASGVVFAVSSPVEHGRVFGSAISRCIPSPCSVWRDSRLDQGVDAPPADFPSVAPRSMARFLRPRHLRLLFRRPPSRDPRAARLYWRYLCFAQRVRRMLAEEAFHRDTDLLVTDFDRHSSCAPIVFAAHQIGIPTATLVHASPASTYLPVVADAVLTWSEAQSAWFNTMQPGVSTHVVGRPDLLEEPPLRSPSADRFIVVHSCEDLSATESETLVGLAASARQDGLKPVLRPHPILRGASVSGRWLDVLAACDGVDSMGTDWLSTAAGVAGVRSSATIDALADGVPVVVVADESRQLPNELSLIASDAVGNSRPWLRDDMGRLRSSILPLRGELAQVRLAQTVQLLRQRRASVLD